MDGADYEPLAEKMNAISLAVERNAYPALAAADLEFHSYIWDHSQNPTLCRMLEQLTAPLFAFVSLVHSSNRDNLRNVVNSHERVISALQEGGARLIRERLREHLAGSYDMFLKSGAEDLHEWYQASESNGKK